ncbi:MAG: ribose ABC transporter permease, partial [Thermotogae bacterium]
FGGLLLSARMYSGDPYAGTSFTLSSISAALIGGVSFAGGRGNIAGTMAGIIIISMLSMLLNLFGVSPFYQNIMEGSILIVAVMISVAQQTSSGRKSV